MSKIDEIKPVSVTYALRDIFNTLDENISELEGKLHFAVQDDKDMTLTINCTQSAIETRKAALEQVRLWMNDGIEYMDTDAIFSESSIPRYIQSDSICAQISAGRLKPTEPHI